MVNNLVKDIELIRGRAEIKTESQTPTPVLSTSSQLHQDASKSLMSQGGESGSPQGRPPCCFYRTRASIERREGQKDRRAERRFCCLIWAYRLSPHTRGPMSQADFGLSLAVAQQCAPCHFSISGLDTSKNSQQKRETCKRRSIYFTVSDQVRRSRGEDDRAAALLPGGGQTGLERLALPCDHASCCSHWGHPGRHHHLPFTHSQRSVCLSTNSCPWVPQSQFLKPGMGKCNSVVAYNVSCEFNMQQQWAMTTEWANTTELWHLDKGAIPHLAAGPPSPRAPHFPSYITWVSTRRHSGPRRICLVPGSELTLTAEALSSVGKRSGQSAFVAVVHTEHRIQFELQLWSLVAVWSWEMWGVLSEPIFIGKWEE